MSTWGGRARKAPGPVSSDFEMFSQPIWGANLEVRTWPCPPTTLASVSPEALGPLLAATHNGLPGRTEGAGRGGAEMTFPGGWGSQSTLPP